MPREVFNRRSVDECIHFNMREFFESVWVVVPDSLKSSHLTTLRASLLEHCHDADDVFTRTDIVEVWRATLTGAPLPPPADARHSYGSSAIPPAVPFPDATQMPDIQDYAVARFNAAAQSDSNALFGFSLKLQSLDSLGSVQNAASICLEVRSRVFSHFFWEAHNLWAFPAFESKVRIQCVYLDTVYMVRVHINTVASIVYMTLCIILQAVNAVQSYYVNDYRGLADTLKTAIKSLLPGVNKELFDGFELQPTAFDALPDKATKWYKKIVKMPMVSYS